MTQEEMQRAFAEYQQRMAEAQMQAVRDQAQAAYWAERSQSEINNRERRKYACIVAVDEKGAFSKDGQIPWHYPEDFKWFQSKTKGHICVMGRTTYDDINARLGEKAAVSVLPDRKVFVVTSSPLPRDNAIAVDCIGAIDILIEDDDINKIVFFCGGERIYSEGIAKSDELYITLVNKFIDGDRFFPTKYTMTNFDSVQVFKHDNQEDLRFTTWKRKA